MNHDIVNRGAFTVCKADLLSNLKQSSERLTGSLSLPDTWFDEEMSFFDETLKQYESHSEDWEAIVRRYDTLEEVIVAMHFITLSRGKQLVIGQLMDDATNKPFVRSILKNILSI